MWFPSKTLLNYPKALKLNLKYHSSLFTLILCLLKFIQFSYFFSMAFKSIFEKLRFLDRPMPDWYAKCEAKTVRKEINHQSSVLSATTGSTTENDPDRPPALSALDHDLDWSPGMMFDCPWMPVFTPSLCWVMDRPPWSISQCRNSILDFSSIDRHSRSVFYKFWIWVRTFWNTFVYFIWVHNTS